MKRAIRQAPATFSTIDVSGLHSDVRSWLEGQANTESCTLRWLLAHADEGVIWGEVRDRKLVTSHEEAPQFSPPLRAETLQTARLFSRTGELFLWRAEGAWSARIVRDVDDHDIGELKEGFDEDQVLWGTRGDVIGGKSFVLMSDGNQGLNHAVPLPQAARDHKGQRPLRLRVRNYVEEDATGFARVTLSRLVDLYVEGAHDR